MVNWKKSDLVPSTRLQYLGIVIHVPRACVSISRSFVTIQEGSHIISPPPFSTSAHVAAASRTYVIAGAFSSRGTHSHATPPVADERQLVASGRRPSQPDPPVSGLYGSRQMMAQGEPVDARGASTRSAPSLSLYTNASLSGWGAHLLDLTSLGVWSEEESQVHKSH